MVTFDLDLGRARRGEPLRDPFSDGVHIHAVAPQREVAARRSGQYEQVLGQASEPLRLFEGAAERPLGVRS